MSAGPRPSVAELPGQCDWGWCNGEATSWRWASDLGCWLPVCDTHRDPRRQAGHVAPRRQEGRA